MFHAENLLRDLQNEVTPKYAVAWKPLGLELGLDEGILLQIGEDYRHVADQCNNMLGRWLERDPNANKAKLSRALNSPAVKAVMQSHQTTGKILVSFPSLHHLTIWRRRLRNFVTCSDVM